MNDKFTNLIERKRAFNAELWRYLTLKEKVNLEIEIRDWLKECYEQTPKSMFDAARFVVDNRQDTASESHCKQFQLLSNVLVDENTLIVTYFHPEFSKNLPESIDYEPEPEVKPDRPIQFILE